MIVPWHFGRYTNLFSVLSFRRLMILLNTFIRLRTRTSIAAILFSYIFCTRNEIDHDVDVDAMSTPLSRTELLAVHRACPQTSLHGHTVDRKTTGTKTRMLQHRALISSWYRVHSVAPAQTHPRRHQESLWFLV